MDTQINNKIKVLSFFCMIALLFVHNYNVSNNIQTPASFSDAKFSPIAFVEYFFSNALFRCRIPLLMAISGYLLAKSNKYSYTELISRKIQTIIFPFIIISCIGFLTCIIYDVIETNFYRNSNTGIFGKPLQEFTFKDAFYQIFITPTSFQLWYLKVMFLFAVATPIIRFFCEKIPFATLSILAILWLFTNVLGGETKDRGYIFFFIGFYLATYNKTISKPLSFLSVKTAALLFIALAITRTGLAFSNLHNSTTVFIMILSFKLIGLFGSYTCWFAVDYLLNGYQKFSWFRNITKSSFFLFAFHAPLLTLSSMALKKYVLQNDAQLFIAYFILPISIALIIMLIDRYVSNNFKNSYALITGGRSTDISLQKINYFSWIENIATKQVQALKYEFRIKDQWQYLQYYTLIIGLLFYKFLQF
ncbi:MAG: acyltransferase family protein [Chitinophagaceae bacterium]